MWDNVDYYDILGINPHSTQDEIKSAYRSLARRFHPDTAQEEHVTQMFRDAHQAYTVLSDPYQRKAYDQWRVKQDLGGSDRGIHLEVTQSHKTLLAVDEPQMLYVLVDVTAASANPVDRLPLNICLVIDRSTSMKGSRLHRVKEAAIDIVGRLNERDILSLVTFNDRAQVVIPAQRAFHRPQTKATISSIQAGGGTELFQGLSEGIRQVTESISAGYVNHLILLTDGQTYGDADLCIDAAEHASQRHIGISTVGIGTDWNDELLDAIAGKSGGNSHYLQYAEEIVAFFQNKVQQLADTLVQEATLTVQVQQGTSLCGAYRITPALTPLPLDSNTFQLGAIGINAGPSVLLELLAPPKGVGQHHLALIALDTVLPQDSEDSPIHINRFVSVKFIERHNESPHIPQKIVSALNNVTMWQMQQKAMTAVDRGQLANATRRLETLATRLLDMGETELARATLLEAGQLRNTGVLTPEGQKRLKYGTRNLSGSPARVNRPQGN